MARQLWLLRHGEAEPHDVALRRRAAPDRRAARTSRAPPAARSPRSRSTFQAVYTSPKVRARDTARLACEALGCEPLDARAAAPGASRRRRARAAARDERVLVVGHEPDFSQVVHDLTGAQIDMKKGGIAASGIDGARGELIVLLRPREIDRLG